MDTERSLHHEMQSFNDDTVLHQIRGELERVSRDRIVELPRIKLITSLEE